MDFFDITPGAAINRLLGACVRCVEVIGEVSKQGPILDSGNPGATGNLTRKDSDPPEPQRPCRLHSAV